MEGEEIELSQEYYMNIHIRQLRERRNKALAETDKYLIIDYPITPDNLMKIKQYRQDLRDYMNKPELYSEIIPFPEFPF